MPLRWGAEARERGAIVVGVGRDRNAIGVHRGQFSVFRAMAIATGALQPRHIPDLRDTQSSASIGPFPQWLDPSKIVSLDPWGHKVTEVFAEEFARGLSIMPTIAIAGACLRLAEVSCAIREGRLEADGTVVSKSGEVTVTRIAIEPVWYLPGIAKRIGVPENRLRQTLFQYTGGMYPELTANPRMHVFLPPVSGLSVYLFGDPARLDDKTTKITSRLHDQCVGSDVFGTDLCTCRPYLVFAVEECIKAAQRNQLGIIVYTGNEGRALGEVTKLLAYNARRRAPLGDDPDLYFHQTEKIAGTRDQRLPQLDCDVYHWLGVTRIERWLSMSNLKYDALTHAGLEVAERVPLSSDLVPRNAATEIEAKIRSGYCS